MLISQSVDSVISQPKFLCKISKSVFVIRPVSVEILRSVETFLKNNPASSIGVLIAKDVERFLAIGFDEVHAIPFETFFKKVHTVFG